MCAYHRLEKYLADEEWAKIPLKSYRNHLIAVVALKGCAER